jgi:hypothetical protein
VFGRAFGLLVTGLCQLSACHTVATAERAPAAFAMTRPKPTPGKGTQAPGAVREPAPAAFDGSPERDALARDRRSFVPAGPGPVVGLEIAAKLTDDGLPDWSFETPGYPAVDRAGTRVAVVTRDDEGLATAPNLRVDIVRVRDGKVLERTSILGLEEFRRAAASATPEALGRGLPALADAVSERLDTVNAEIDPREWAPLKACTGPIRSSGRPSWVPLRRPVRVAPFRMTTGALVWPGASEVAAPRASSPA